MVAATEKEDCRVPNRPTLRQELERSFGPLMWGVSDDRIARIKQRIRDRTQWDWKPGTDRTEFINKHTEILKKDRQLRGEFGFVTVLLISIVIQVVLSYLIDQWSAGHS